MGLPKAFGFEMNYLAAFEQGCLEFSSRRSPGLMELTDAGQRHPDLKETDGYREELAYFVDCVEKNELPAVVTPESSAFSVRLLEAERQSAEEGRLVTP